MRPLRNFDRSMEQWLGADMRLLYGMAIPILTVVGVICILALSPATWLVVAVLVVEGAMLGLVGVGFAGLFTEDGGDDRNPD